MAHRFATKEESEKAERELANMIAYLNSLKDDYCHRADVEVYDYVPSLGFAIRKLEALLKYFDDINRGDKAHKTKPLNVDEELKLSGR